jgi:hypothetical protein
MSILKKPLPIKVGPRMTLFLMFVILSALFVAAYMAGR